MEQEIRVLLVDENREALASLSKQLDFDEITVVGQSGFGPVAYNWATQLHPDVALVAVEEPVARALKTVEALALGQPGWPVVVISSKADPDTMRKSMRAGADDYLLRSATPEELHATITSIFRRERQREALDATGGEAAGHYGTVITVFGVKGGIGKTTLATNLAAGIATASKQRIALVDLDLQFGDVALVMEAPPDKTIADAIDALDRLDADLVDGFMSKHKTGVRVLPAPLHIDSSENITGHDIERLLHILASVYDYVILDAPNTLNGQVLSALDMSTLIILVTTPEIPCIRRTKACLDLMQDWQYSEDKVKLVINKVDGHKGLSPEDIEYVLRYPAYWKLPFDTVADAVKGSGILCIHSDPKARISRDVLALSRKLLGADDKPKPSLFDRIKHPFGLLQRNRGQPASNKRNANVWARVREQAQLGRANRSAGDGNGRAFQGDDGLTDGRSVDYSYTEPVYSGVGVHLDDELAYRESKAELAEFAQEPLAGDAAHRLLADQVGSHEVPAEPGRRARLRDHRQAHTLSGPSRDSLRPRTGPAGRFRRASRADQSPGEHAQRPRETPPKAVGRPESSTMEVQDVPDKTNR
ncbi:MAG: AAA family ATPase [Chloroflexi bacterium]|nr:AAA family ATPase [Chloroflexota bacterium]